MSHVHCEDGAFNEDVPSQSLGAILRSKAKSQKNSSTDMNYSSSPSRSEDDLSESRSDQGGYEEVSELNRTLSDNEEDSHHDGPGEQYDTTQADPSAMLDEKGDIHAIGTPRLRHNTSVTAPINSRQNNDIAPTPPSADASQEAVPSYEDMLDVASQASRPQGSELPKTSNIAPGPYRPTHLNQLPNNGMRQQNPAPAPQSAKIPEIGGHNQRMEKLDTTTTSNAPPTSGLGKPAPSLTPRFVTIAEFDMLDQSLRRQEAVITDLHQRLSDQDHESKNLRDQVARQDEDIRDLKATIAQIVAAAGPASSTNALASAPQSSNSPTVHSQEPNNSTMTAPLTAPKRKRENRQPDIDDHDDHDDQVSDSKRTKLDETPRDKKELVASANSSSSAGLLASKPGRKPGRKAKVVAPKVVAPEDQSGPVRITRSMTTQTLKTNGEEEGEAAPSSKSGGRKARMTAEEENVHVPKPRGRKSRTETKEAKKPEMNASEKPAAKPKTKRAARNEADEEDEGPKTRQGLRVNPKRKREIGDEVDQVDEGNSGRDKIRKRGN